MSLSLRKVIESIRDIGLASVILIGTTTPIYGKSSTKPSDDSKDPEGISPKKSKSVDPLGVNKAKQVKSIEKSASTPTIPEDAVASEGWLVVKVDTP